MASFEKRGDYQWRAKVRRHGQPLLTKTFETRKDAEDWAREIERKIKRGEIDELDPQTQQTTVAIALKSYIDVVLPTLAREGQSKNAPLARIKQKFGPLYIAALRPPAINSWAAELAQNYGLSGQTVVHHLNTLSSLIRHAQTHLGVHLPAGNPLRLVTRPAAGKSRDRVLRTGELELLIRAANDPGTYPNSQAGPYLEPIIRLALATSMRLGELVALRTDWIDQKTRVVKLPADTTKNGETRNVALSSGALAILNGMPINASGRVFGKWAGTGSFNKPWQRLMQRARRLYTDDCLAQGIEPDPAILKDLRFHDLRHVSTTALFSQGLSPFEVASMTGHKSMQMLKRYTHVDAAKLAIKLG